MAQLALKNIKKIYNKEVVAVRDFNLEIHDKEFIVFVGPSGCGKSTTLRMIAGLEEISEGELYINDQYMNDIAPKDRDIAMVFQNYALYPHMTVAENMSFSLKMHKVSKADRMKKVTEAAEILGITDLLKRKPKELSGGQRQRVAIGRAIVRAPKVFLMDEPLSNLDAKLRNQMRTEMIKLRHSINSTFIYVTHDQTEAMTLGDRIVIMKDGEIVQTGTPQEVFNQPAHRFVAEFIGSPQMNLIEGSLNKDGADYSLRIMNTKIALPDKMQLVFGKNGVASQDVIAGIRPEHVSLYPVYSAGCLRAKVNVSEMMGSTIHLHTECCGENIVIVTQLSDIPDDFKTDFSFGSEVYISFDPHHIHLFSKKSERNLLLK